MSEDREHSVAMGEVDAPASPTHINVGKCRCPGSPHPFDTVDLKELDVPLAIAANTAIRPVLAMFSEGEITQSEANEDVEAALAGVYLRHAIEAWSFTDEKGLPVPIRPSNAKRLLSYESGGLLVQEAADKLYSERISAPFIEAGKAIQAAMENAETERRARLNREQRRAIAKSSRNGQTDGSTSAAPNSGSKRRPPSASFSPTTSAGMPSGVPVP